MTLVDGEKAVARALGTAADGGGGSRALWIRGSGREDTGLSISRESREPIRNCLYLTATQTRDHGPDSGRARPETPHPPTPEHQAAPPARGSGVTRRSECADGPPILIEAAHSHTMRNTAR